MASAAHRRLSKDLEHLGKQNNPQVTVRPSSTLLLEWHFVLHHLPSESVYAGGYYHGKLIFPEQYPMAPPSLLMVTPSGRLETNRKLCLSMTDYHPESWNPAWTVESILVGLISFMIDERDPTGLGVVTELPDTRRRLARSSIDFNRGNSEFAELFPEFAFLEAPHASATADEEAPEDSRRTQLQPSKAAGLNIASRPHEEDASHKPLIEACACYSSTGGASALPAEAAPVDVDGDTPECWICREGSSQEELMQPCACRGSMSSVHASCVEAWIKHSQEHALTDQMPKCPVCRQVYSGAFSRPGVLTLAGQCCIDYLRRATGAAQAGLCIVMYLWAAEGHIFHSTWVRILMLILSGSIYLYKSLVLACSLPRGRLPPRNCASYFFTTKLRLHAAYKGEIGAVVGSTATLWLYGQIPYYCFVPVCIFPVLPLFSLSVTYAQQHSCYSCCYSCLVGAGAVLLGTLLCPFIIVGYSLNFLWENRMRMVDLSDAPLHVLVAASVLIMCFFLKSPITVMILLGLHSSFLLGGLIEKVAVRRVHWKEGPMWWNVLPVGFWAAWTSMLVYSLKAMSVYKMKPRFGVGLVMLLPLIWLGLLCVFSLLVNWGLCLEQYHAWQNRHGSFQLHTSTRPAVSPLETIENRDLMQPIVPPEIV